MHHPTVLMRHLSRIKYLTVDPAGPAIKEAAAVSNTSSSGTLIDAGTNILAVSSIATSLLIAAIVTRRKAVRQS
jgi:hypothetical protein